MELLVYFEIEKLVGQRQIKKLPGFECLMPCFIRTFCERRSANSDCALRTIDRRTVNGERAPTTICRNSLRCHHHILYLKSI